MIYYFNPGHETAVLNASKYYQPAANQVKMQQELAFLPAWYAAPDDFVLIENELPGIFQKEIKTLNPIAKSISISELEERRKELFNQSIGLWGISPQSIYLFEKLNNHYNFQWQIPEWKEEFRYLGSRMASHQALSHLLNTIPGLDKAILPKFFSTIAELEDYIIHRNEKLLVKSPYSSSGRGLVWLPPGPLARSEKQIICGMLKKQTQVSVEKALDKQLDFSMHFEIDQASAVHFIGYSIFQTNEKGAYQESLLANQDFLEKQITALIDKELLYQVRNELLTTLQKMYAPYYTGTIGVDMLVYQSENQYRLNPCLEINMRKSMGYLAIQLQNNHLHPLSKGFFRIDYASKQGELLQKHQELKKQYPVVIDNNRIVSGYLGLCPVTETSGYLAYVMVE
ncbi:hypothetical protein FACS189437_06760 [Bacteroidia bacterium]|nr:hypothetical protein FACS189437_06760 [Bacteroidia bacterium]